MPDQTAQPTILVKKADGTTARLTLDEVMKMRGKKQETRNKIQETKKPASAEAMAGRQEIEKLETGNSKLETRKKEETKKQEAKSREQGTRRELSTINNQQSPINKQPAVLAPVAKPPIAGQEDQLDIIFRWLDFSIADDLRGRLRSLIESRVKGVRTDAQFLLYAGKPASEGGLGFTPEQADDLLAVVKDIYGIKPQAPRVVAKPAPVKTAAAWAEEDTASPLTEEPTKKEVGEIAAAPKEPEKDALEVIRPKLNFQVADNLADRLRTLVEARVKDVRTDDQFLEYAMKDAKTGGLGLTAEQAETLLREVKEEFRIEQRNRPVRRRRKIQEIRNKEQGTKNREQRTGNNKQRIASAGSLSPITYHLSPNVGQPTGRHDRSSAQPAVSQAGKPILHDVIPPKVVPPPASEIKRSVGPVDEIRLFTLVDFRRLSADAGKAGEMLIAKFETIKKESHLLFLQAKEAWKESPLYREYLDVLKRAMSAGKTVDEILAAQGKGGLGKGEFSAVVELNKQLG
ncbi:MAG: hypothetical protein A3C90_01765 [Candidatus Magasanikbacteria bacterium RIFCSPHIGHO2_02_FULL_51_14]|uniref:Uncharacterized protein n=1 Tax=Candidatus Magasanikbacteria bacterium RIFCSPHIGHO2_02_FULL_51_14 TaxID=1798683 RepID=A0A1F6MGM7_9BACT|nr:MAG: hypothetical protein A3C90_01765 [Candidatus Magasanikbacteria bacterium RIFCSPHIGHO2_02_FULL_51_14]